MPSEPSDPSDPSDLSDRDDHDRFVAVMEMMAKLIRAPEAEGRLAADREAFLGAAGLGKADLASFAAVGDKRLLLYRKLVRRGLAAAIRMEIPRTAARLGARFDEEVDRFLDEEAPRTHYLRDVGFELVAWAAPRWAASPDVPGYLADLARHELSALDVTASDARGRSLAARLGLAQKARAEGDAEEEDAGLPLALGLDQAARFDAAVRLCRYTYAVHRLDADEDARDEPAREPTALLAYRDAEHDVRYLELTPLAAAILERLLRGETLRAAVIGGAGELGHPLDGAVLSSTADLLSDLTDRGVVLGGAPAAAEDPSQANGSTSLERDPSDHA